MGSDEAYPTDLPGAGPGVPPARSYFEDLKTIAERESEVGNTYVGAACAWAVKEIERLRGKREP